MKLKTPKYVLLHLFFQSLLQVNLNIYQELSTPAKGTSSQPTITTPTIPARKTTQQSPTQTTITTPSKTSITKVCFNFSFELLF